MGFWGLALYPTQYTVTELSIVSGDSLLAQFI